MVGLFGRGSKSPSTRPSRSSTDASQPAISPPPPYTAPVNPRDHAVFTETTTTTHVVTTTTQTTHFFSLPLFRRRAHMEPPDALRHSDRSEAELLSDEHGVLSTSNPVVLLRDKELPPTPSLSEDGVIAVAQSTPQTRSHTDSVASSASESRISNSTSFDSSVSNSMLSKPVSLVLPSGSSSNELSTHPTATLARAALGLGLPPVMLNTESSPSTSSELNTVSFVPPNGPPSSPLTRSSTSVMRRVKSFHRDPDMPPDAPPSELRERRRTRGLSLGPFFTSDGKDGKGKERQHDVETPPPLPKTLNRKPSFWSRMRKDSQHTSSPLVASLPQELSVQPSLPSLQPVSPFYVEPAPSLAPTHTRQPSDLRRRHSERGPVSPKSDDFSVSTPNPESPDSRPHLSPRRRPRRPQTADSSAMIRSASSFYPAPSPALPSTQSFSARPSPRSSRPRSHTNPPLLHRLSLNLFGSTPPSHSPVNNNQSDIYLVESPSSSQSGSARPSISKSGSRPSPRPSVEVPRPRHSEESPEVYLNRLIEAVSKAEVANVLASSADEFHTRALRSYIERFDFSADPLDVALRRLLMDVGLPRETQQIDRVMEAFAARYVQCHPNLFASDDHPYVLAFSLIMLHTDAFNKSNKRKMTKPDYIKNTRLPGVPIEVLDCFYDNIVFAPFIFIEDPLDVNGQRGLAPPDSTPARRMSTYNTHSPGGLNSGSSTFLGKSNKIDPYYLIAHNLLDGLRVQVQSFVPSRSPYLHRGTAASWDEDELLRAFVLASVIEVRAPDTGYYPAPWFSLGVSGGPGPMSISGGIPPAYPPGPESFSLKVTKVGSLSRKDDVLEGGRRAINRKWKDWSVLLTGSQLLFSRDPTWATLIQSRADPANGELSMPQPLIPKPDEMMSVKDAIAVYDKSYMKYRNTLRLVLPDGRQILLRASDEDEMNSWIARINYASAFKTAGVRMRSLGMSGRDIELTGQAAAASHLRDLQFHRKASPSPRILTWGDRSSGDIDVSKRRSMAFVKGQHSPSSPSSATSRMRAGSVDSGNDDTISPSIDHSARIIKATFEQVKDELASGRWRSSDETSLQSLSRPRALSLESSIGAFTSTPKAEEREAPRISSRSKIIQSKIHELQSKISLAQKQLDSDTRFVQNIATMTPFQHATRERLQVAVQNVSKRIVQVRLDMEKLVCHRDVLSRDLLSEERDWQRTKRIALQAATAKLRSQQQEIPRMTLSVYMDESERRSPSPNALSSRGPAESPRPAESSTSESFHSAMDISLDWPPSSSSDGNIPAVRLNTQTGLQDGRTSSSSFSFIDSPERSRAATLTAERSFESTSSAMPLAGHEKFYTATETLEEQAEEWDKTRAAKRVSLVKLPSDLRMSALFGKHVSESISEDTQTPDSPSGQSTHSSTTLGPSLTAPYTRSRGAESGYASPLILI